MDGRGDGRGGRPARGEHEPYYGLYIDQVPDRDGRNGGAGGGIVETLARQLEETSLFLSRIDEARASHRYAPGKWSIKQVVGHVVDVERVFATRGLVTARGDASPMPGLEQDQWVQAAGFDERTFASLVAEYRLVRASNVALFDSWTDEQSLRVGQASGCSFTARCWPWIIAGHELHHVRVLRERYL